MDALLHDIRHAVRALRADPGFTIAAVVALTLGIGANVAIFTVIEGVLLRPLPYAEPDRVVRVFDVNRESSIFTGTFSPQDFDDLARDNPVFQSLGAYWYSPGQSGMNLSGEGEPLRVSDALVSTDFFRTLGVAAARGRTLVAAENVPGADRVVVLSDAFWRRRFDANPNIIGRTISLDERPFTIIGIMPPSFEFPSRDVDVWAPISLVTDDMIPHRRAIRWMDVIARLRPAVSLTTAERETSVFIARLARTYPESNKGWETAHLLTLHDAVAGTVRPALIVLLAAVGLVLLIACANVANLLFARATARQRELAVRAALGAGRSRLAWQLLTESALLSLLGGALGLVLAQWGVQVLVALGGTTIPRSDAIRLDARVVGFALVVSLLTALVFGLLPALHAARADYQILRDGGRGASAGRSRRSARGALVIIETALAMLLLVGAGLMVKSFWQLSRVDPGFRAQHVLSVQIAIPDSRFAVDEGAAYRDAILRRLASLPGVIAAGGSKTVPLQGGGEPYEFTIPDRPSASATVRPKSGAYIVTPGYFQALDIPIIRGRAFLDTDRPPGPEPIIVNQAFAREYWGSDHVVGKMLRIGTTDMPIVGVVGNVHNDGLAAAPLAAVYVPMRWFPRSALDILVRTAGDPLQLAGAVRRAIWDVDREQPITNVTALRQIVTDTVARPRFFTALVGLFGALAVALAAMGIYGVLSYAVRQRTNEIGVRMALGARPGDVLTMVIRQSMSLAAIGVAAGAIAALILTRFLQSLLYGVSPTDAPTFLAVAGILFGVALLACWLPARRATRVDPMIALRVE